MFRRRLRPTVGWSCPRRHPSPQNLVLPKSPEIRTLIRQPFPSCRMPLLLRTINKIQPEDMLAGPRIHLETVPVIRRIRHHPAPR